MRKTWYFKIKDSKEEIKVSFDYDLGGISYLSGQTNRRGYYLYVKTVTRDRRPEGYSFESCTLFDGFKVLLKEVPRKSKKAEGEAEAKAVTMAYHYALEMAKKKGVELLPEEEAEVI